jgi:predicted secreted protein
MMFAVLDREGLTESEEGERLIDAFNRGFHRGETAWTRCTPAAEAWQRRASARAQGAADTLASLRPDASTP